MKKSLLLSLVLLAIFASSLRAQVILQDNFTYADGLTTNVSGGQWARFSGTSNDSFVKNGRLEVFGTRFDDINRAFSPALSSTIAYASFIVNATNLSASTNYFAHFKDSGNSNFRGRVFAAGPGVVANTWRLGISAAGAAATAKIFPLDLATNVDYRVVISYDTVGFLGTLWVDPVSSTDPNVLTSDSTSAATIIRFAFRQSSPNPAVLVDDLYVGNSFDDVNVGAVKPATIYAQPAAGPTTNFAGNNLTLSCVAGGAGTVTFQWQRGGLNVTDDANHVGATSNVLSLVSTIVSQSGDYRCIVTSTTNSVFSSSATSTVAQVWITNAPVPPTFITQPVSQTVYSGQNVTFSTTVSSPGNVSYQWKSNNVDLVGETGPTLTLVNVTTAYSGAQYRVGVTNDVVATGILSTNAVLTVSNAPAVSVAFVRSLVDPVTLQAAPGSTQPYSITGTITTFTNITGGNTSSYYLQDGTGGINIFATFGSAFRPAQGDIVTFVGIVSSFSSGLELVANTNTLPYTSYSIVSSGNPLPTPVVIPFNLTNAFSFPFIATNIASKLVTLTNVYFGTNAGLQISTNNSTVTVTNASGDPFYLSFFRQCLDTAGQTMPTFATSVTGILYGNHPNYSVGVTKFSDIVSIVPAIPLGYSYSGGNLTLTWSDPSFKLQMATNVVGPYTTLTGATTGFTTNTLAAEMYFRLVNP
jgi:hypothetical protein